MKVIFLKDVPDVAYAGELKEVASGYGRNYLLPRGLAALATTATMDKMKSLQKQAEIKRQQFESEVSELAANIEGKELVFEAKAGASEKLFGSITASDIADELLKAHGITIDKKKIELVEPIKRVGDHDVSIKLSKGIEPIIKVKVIAKEAQ
ncbi:MAG: 50S ribosomal protein L9 [Dehalococcoidales bacterium]|jgi:large subunit ribosomal protein L9